MNDTETSAAKQGELHHMDKFETIPGRPRAVGRKSKSRRKKEQANVTDFQNIQIFGNYTEEDLKLNLIVAREEVKQYCSQIDDFLQQIRGK